MCQMIEEEQFNTLLDAVKAPSYTRVRFMSLPLVAGMKTGIPLGQGKCKAVELSANHFIVGTVNPQSALTSAKFYYGDAGQQTFEQLINTNTTAGNTNNRTTGIIPCTDLNQVFVKFSDSAPAILELQVKIYD